MVILGMVARETISEVKHDVYGKRQTAKNETCPVSNQLCVQ